MTYPVRTIAPAWEIVLNNTYVLTEADVENGFNKLGMDVSHIPLNVRLCGGCDQPLQGSLCFDCQTIHEDCELPELNSEVIL